MPKPYKLFSTRPLPPDAEIVDEDGKPHVRLRERGKPILYRLTKDGRNYLRPSKRWYFDVRDAAGSVRRVKGFADLKATERLAADKERQASRVRAGFTDPAEEHARRPLADHLKDYAAAPRCRRGIGGTASPGRSRRFWPGASGRCWRCAAARMEAAWGGRAMSWSGRIAGSTITGAWSYATSSRGRTTRASTSWPPASSVPIAYGTDGRPGRIGNRLPRPLRF